MWLCIKAQSRGLSSAGAPSLCVSPFFFFFFFFLSGRKRSKFSGLTGYWGNPDLKWHSSLPPSGALGSQCRAKATGRPPWAPLPHLPSSCLASHLTVRMCTHNLWEEISTMECAVQQPVDRMGPQEREQVRRAQGDQSWEGKQRCAQAAGQAAPVQPLFLAPQVRCTGLLAESQPPLSIAPAFPRSTRHLPVPHPDLWAWTSLGKRQICLHPPTSSTGLCLSLACLPSPH